MDAFELLEKDHRKVEGIFAQLEPTTERAVKTRQELFEKLRMELEIHTQIEETILYPVLKQVSETREITFEGYEEHNVAKQILMEMSEMGDVSDEVWTAKLKVLQESIEHHVEEEESEMFPEARSALSKEQIEELAVSLEAAKKELRATMTASA